MNQHEITERRPLLDASGNLTEPGYAKTLLPIYRRSDIKAGKMRIKEWDYYLVTDGHIGIALPHSYPACIIPLGYGRHGRQGQCQSQEDCLSHTNDNVDCLMPRKAPLRSPLSKVTTNRANKAEALKEIGDQTAFFAEKHLNLR